MQLKKACEANPANWDAAWNVLYLMTRPDSDHLAPLANVQTARQFCLDILQCVWTTGTALKEGVPVSGPLRLPPCVPVSDCAKMQKVFLTMGALAREAGNLQMAFLDYVNGIEVALSRTGGDQSAAGDAVPLGAPYTFRELLDALNYHVQLTWLAKSADPAEASNFRQALREETGGAVEISQMRENALQ